MAHRTGKVWVPGGVGWVSKKATESRDYSDFDDDSWSLLISYWRWYPDALIDLLRSDNADYKNEELIQRVMMRVFARNQDVYITGTRGVTKTNTKFKQKLTWNILWPGTQSAYYGPSFKQMASIGKKAYEQLQHDYPALTAHWTLENSGKDSFKITTPYNSSFSIDAFRGDNLHDVTAEEYAQTDMPMFDYDEFSTVVTYAVRLRHMIKGTPDPTYIEYQEHYITSAGRKQGQAYDTRKAIKTSMEHGELSYVMDIPWEVVVLSFIRPYSWAARKKEKATPDKWLREMCSIYTGSAEHPMLSDEILAESAVHPIMETQHCGDPDVMYIIGYDVSSEATKQNAECATTVFKCERQEDFIKRDRFLKTQVYVDSWLPQSNSMEQAKKLKSIWYDFCYKGETENAKATYIAIDARSYGKAVIEDLMKDMNDGLPPLCIKDHEEYTDLELDGALPVIYPVKAGGQGTKDKEGDMLDYVEIQFRGHNVKMLTTNISDGVTAYKRAHRIKDDYIDSQIAKPYIKTRALIAQIQNLQTKPSGAGRSVVRISHHIQKDMWSATEYPLWLAQIIEREELKDSVHKKTGWEAELAKYREAGAESAAPIGFAMRGIGRIGGRRF